MTRKLHSRPVWVVQLNDEERADFERLLGTKLKPKQLAALREALFVYSREQAALKEGVTPIQLRKRLFAIAKSCGECADLLGAERHFADDYSAVNPPRRLRIPRSAEPAEARTLMRVRAADRDVRLQQEFGIDPKLREIEPLEFAWRLAHLAVSATEAARAIRGGKGGQPSGGTRELVGTLISITNTPPGTISCKFNAASDEYEGSFPAIADWLFRLGVRGAKRSTLCQYAVEELRGQAAKKKPRARKRVGS